MNIHILLNYIDLSRQATANLHMHWPRFSLKLVVTCVINWQAGTKLIRHGEERDGFVTPSTAAIKKRYDGFKGISGLQPRKHIASGAHYRHGLIGREFWNHYIPAEKRIKPTQIIKVSRNCDLPSRNEIFLTNQFPFSNTWKLSKKWPLG